MSTTLDRWKEVEADAVERKILRKHYSSNVVAKVGLVISKFMYQRMSEELKVEIERAITTTLLELKREGELPFPDAAVSVSLVPDMGAVIIDSPKWLVGLYHPRVTPDTFEG